VNKRQKHNENIKMNLQKYKFNASMKYEMGISLKPEMIIQRLCLNSRLPIQRENELFPLVQAAIT
jgi:hypothetical protein